MAYHNLALSSLIVNPANDRHGALDSEAAAIAHLFATQEAHMRNLAKDIVSQNEVFEPPLVYPEADKYIVADGNRRTTCLKLLMNPRQAPTVELQEFFAELKSKWAALEYIECRIEHDLDRVDEILFRRHTGVQKGIGQSNWTDRMQNNFVARTGKGNGVHIADEIEKRLKAEGRLPSKKIPRANLSRLVSSEPLRNHVGISIKKGQFEIIRNEEQTLSILQRIADDLAFKRVVLGDIWDTDSKSRYIDSLDREGLLPTEQDTKKPKKEGKASPSSAKVKSTPATKQVRWPHLIPNINHDVVWGAHLQRHREIWEELQFRLNIDVHLNAISVLLRVLLELSIDNFVERAPCATVHGNDKLAIKAGKVADQLFAEGRINKKYQGVIRKLQQGDELLSIDTLNRYVHSPNFNVSPEHLRMLWSTLSEFIILCLRA
ncbi:hypothetical protein [Acetobacter senegalensis]|uniref:hypothetical protein n=1 Tax=Acetobacter senegalensis TaxID=446692 RepID=UPI00128E942A|nr:hypothetical protein [Acetobacter senegalensis]MCG4257705.1 hypothetical protein [Acetobacter senegalensis]MCG4267771.1 hypothetical protein [Acetobacter senegalensis]MPQ74779.1 hypothetical protein [Acetobacter senegalensis]